MSVTLDSEVGIDLTVEIDLSGTNYGDSPTWTDVTEDVWVTGGSGVQMTWGRQDWISNVSAASCSFTLDNHDGKYTPRLSSSPYYPNVRRRARCRVSAFIASTTVYLFDGLIDSWDTSWENGVYSLTEVSATDMLGRLGTEKSLRSMFYEEIISDGPVGFYPLNDQGPTLGDIIGTYPTLTAMVGAGGPDVAYQNVTGCADQAVVGVGLGGYYSYISASAASIGYPTFELFFTTSFTGFACTLAGDLDGVTGIGIDSAGYITDGTSTGPFVADGGIHQLLFIYDGTPTGHGSWYLDGTLVGDIEWSAVWFFAFNFVGTVWSLAIYGAAVPSALRFGDHLTGAQQGFAAEQTDAHMARLLKYRTHFGSVMNSGIGYVGVHSTDGVSLQQALYDTADAEGSVVFADGQGQIIFLNRSWLFSPTAAFTLDASTGEIDSTVVYRNDSQFTVNKVNVTTPAGASQSYEDPTSITADGVCEQDIELIVDTDAHAYDAAKWRVQVGVQDQTYVSQLDVNLFTVPSASTVLAVLQARPLDVVHLTGLPETTPDVHDFMVQGGTLTIGVEEFAASLFTTFVPAGDTY